LADRPIKPTGTTGPVRCLQCGHDWIAACPPKSQPIRCPRCGSYTWTLLWKPDARAPEVSVN
jgi:DNA-directed RNA polymerase subunit RPC12/RpoP